MAKDFERIDDLGKELNHLKLIFRKNAQKMEEILLRFEKMQKNSDTIMKSLQKQIDLQVNFTASVLDNSKQIIQLNKKLNERIGELLRVE